MLNLSKAGRIALVVTPVLFAAACASNDQLSAVRAEADKALSTANQAQATANQALATANQAASAAQAADAKATSAAQAAADAAAKAQAVSDKLDRIWHKGLRK
jgi:hypothetical protein